jgi:hypothetical protein
MSKDNIPDWVDKRTYGSFRAMKRRCEEKNDINYKYYGARGIKVCEEWRLFKNFVSDMGIRPEGKTLDRINPNGNYEKSNCRWATAEQQIKNRRHRKDSLTHNGITKTKKEWSEWAGINFWTLRERLEKMGWSLEKTLTTPTQKRGAKIRV